MKLNEIKAPKPKPITRDVLLKSNKLNGEQSRGFRIELLHEIEGFTLSPGPMTYHNGVRLISPTQVEPGVYQKAAMYIQELKMNMDPSGHLDDLFGMDTFIGKTPPHNDDLLFLPVHLDGGYRNTANAIMLRFTDLLNHARLISERVPSLPKASPAALQAAAQHLEKAFSAGPAAHAEYLQLTDYWKDTVSGISILAGAIKGEALRIALATDNHSADDSSYLDSQLHTRTAFIEQVFKRLMFDNPELAKAWFQQVPKKRP